MDCSQTSNLMAAHLAGEHAPDGWRALRAHLEACPPCRAEAQTLARTWETLAALPEAEPPAGVWERIQERLPVAEAVRRAPWAASVATAALGLVVSIAASWLIPYEQAVSLCGEALRRLTALSFLPEPAVFFVVGILYGLLPLGLVALAAARRVSEAGRHPGIVAGLVFGALALPYAIIACSGLPVAFTAALIAGITAGALAGGPAGLWAGGKLFPPAPA